MKVSVFFMAAVAAGTSSAWAAGPYAITDLGNLGEAPSFALDVNNNRQVSGNSTITTTAAAAEGATGSRLRAFSWTGGTMTNLGALPGATTNRFARGYAVNDSGVVGGEFNNDASRAFVHQNGAMTGLTRLAGDNDRGVAQDINNAGVIVGISSNGTASRATRWTFDGSIYVPADLGSIDGTTTTSSRANAINQSGVIAGFSRDAGAATSQATLWSGGTVTDLGSLGDGNRFSQAFGLNGSNTVVGSSSTGQTVGQLIGTTSSTGITRAFAWSGGTMSELSPFNLYTTTNTGSTTNYHSVAMDINDAGLIVGNSQRIAGSPAVATLWENGVPIDLNTLIPADSGWNLLSAEGINEAGDITGYGTFGGQTRAFLVTVPEPATAGMLGIAAVAVLARRTRRGKQRDAVHTVRKPLCRANAAAVLVLTVLTCAPAAQAEVDILVYQSGGSVRTGAFDFGSSTALPGHRVFTSQLEALAGAPGAAFSSDPGWNAVENAAFLPSGASKLPGQVDVGFNLLAHPSIGRNLAFWDGTGPVTFDAVPGGEALKYSKGLASFIVADGGTNDVAGYTVARTNGGGYIHRHLEFALYGNDSLSNASLDAPTPGIYLLAFEATVQGFTEPADPFFVLLGNGVTSGQLGQAESWANATLVPEPSSAIAIAAASVLGLARRRRRFSQT